MTLRERALRWLRRAFAPVLCFCAIGYFGYHTVQGQHGLIAYTRLTQDLERVRRQHAEARLQRQLLEHRAALLRPDRIDRDMLDERARELLGIVHPHDIVVFLPERD